MKELSQVRFADLRVANVARIPLFRNARGQVVHNEDGSDWIMSQWMNAITGELGEAANIVKKLERGDCTLDDDAATLDADKYERGSMTVRQALAKEFADVACYLDIAAFRTGVDLGAAVRDKFNEVSDRVEVDVKITEDERGTGVDYIGGAFPRAARERAREAIK